VIRAAVLTNREEIRAADLPIHGYAAGHASPANGHAAVSIESLEGMERKMIFDALNATNGHQQKAAAKLGISRRTLSRKLKVYETGGMAEASL
jgi:DNA-binding NtrC family response regulator